ncbi:cupin domain-containing protein [Altibacter lentus]|uniref:cupin domain-containing protein n=1 Tax=Altibacter lentus TaxID=1223410 RepID=UPI001E2E2CF5|nr:cupin domain-containing protein [Altibacter lentus]
MIRFFEKSHQNLNIVNFVKQFTTLMYKPIHYFINERISVVVVLLILTTIGCTKKNRLPDPLAAGWKDQAVCELLQENDHLRVLRCTFAPGVGHEKHYHAPHIGYTIAGSRFRITDTTGSREVDVPTGYHFDNEYIEWHEVLNIGDSTAVFLIIESK